MYYFNGISPAFLTGTTICIVLACGCSQTEVQHSASSDASETSRESTEEQAKIFPVLSGVGLALTDKDGHIYVTKVLPDSPAAQSKQIAEGDRLLSVIIDGVETSLEGKSYSEAASLIRGPVGTELIVSFMPLNKDVAFDVRLTREPLAIAGASNSSYKDFVGRPMPELTLKSLDEKKSSQLKDYHGKVVVLDFWASWCPTCYSPVTKLQKIVTDNPQWREKVEFITVTVDSNLEKAQAVIEKQKWNHTRNSAVDIEALNEIGVSVIPLVVIIAPDGTIAAMAGAHAIDVEKEVASIVMRPPSRSPGTATDLRSELLLRRDIDQEARVALIQWEKEHGPVQNLKSTNPKEAKAEFEVFLNSMPLEYRQLVERLNKIDNENTAWMKAVIKEHGWPTNDMVGKDGAAAAWLLVQHADMDTAFQRQCLDSMTQLPKNSVSQQDLAYLTDRVLLAEGKKQLYGTQFTKLDGKLTLRPVEDESQLDSRRSAMGLPPMAEQLKMLKDLYVPSNDASKEE